MADKQSSTYTVAMVAEFSDGDTRTLTQNDPLPDNASLVAAINAFASYARTNNILVGDKAGGTFTRIKEAKKRTVTSVKYDIDQVVGVTQGFTKNLEIAGVGYRAAKQGKNLNLSLGYSHPVIIEPPAGITLDAPSATTITVHGIDKELVGAVAANIRSWREPEPYKGKGIKYAGEHIRRKEGKAGAKGKK